jgi:hypothetical protein
VNVASHIEAHTAAHPTAHASNTASQAAEPSGPSFLDSLDSMMAAAGNNAQQPTSGAHKSMVDASGNGDADGVSNAHREQAATSPTDPSDSSATNAPAKTPLAFSDSLTWTSKLSADPIAGTGNNMVKGKFTGSDDDKSGPRKTAGTDTASSPIYITGAPVLQPVPWSLDPQSLSSGSHTAPIAVDEQPGMLPAGSQPVPSTNLPIAMGPVGQPDQPAGVDTTGPQNNTFDPASQQTETAAKPAAGADNQASAPAAHPVQQAQEAAATSASAAASILSANALSAQSAVTDPGAAALASQALAASMSKNFAPSQNLAGAAAAAKASGLATNNAAAKPGSKGSIKDITDLKSDNSVAVQSDSQTASNTKTSTSTSDHAQHDANAQQQAAAVPVTVTVQHTPDATLHQPVAAPAHTTDVAASTPRATADAASTLRDHAAEAAATSASSTTSSTSATTPSSSINTARLIQSVGQSEMRVGMRSAEFGDISIRTSATHDSLSAQISLDHADLAKALTAHLPDMQARLGGNGNVDVRVNNHTQSSMSQSGSQNHQPAGNSDGGDGSRNRSQQSGSNIYSQSRSYNLGQQFASVPAALAANGVSNGRLSIQA